MAARLSQSGAYSKNVAMNKHSKKDPAPKKRKNSPSDHRNFNLNFLSIMFESPQRRQAKAIQGGTENK